MSNIIVDTVKMVARIAPPKEIRLSKPDTDRTAAMLWITYDTMTETRRMLLDGSITETGFSRPADTYHYIADIYTADEWQKIMSEAGWILGGGYMYRWHSAPGRESLHLWGLEIYDFGDGDVSATGDSSYALAELCKKFGNWEWEINSAWRRQDKLIKWRTEDPQRGEDGLRFTPFPGWAGEHPWARAKEEGTGYESHYCYVKPPKYNKREDILAIGAK